MDKYIVIFTSDDVDAETAPDAVRRALSRVTDPTTVVNVWRLPRNADDEEHLYRATLGEMDKEGLL